ncbi:RagB/SusD family nutrient uptake outer membrane protein [Hymenobacter yonginensis]|uniref:RagB/SusD family nutrient uptake outer membrane protein n=1 Tax=Hymenobacter yonginensis TaxID=748197 RepID=A0ABY7PR66_9BACT|nr:RagB/SusD family nutrient uptake outer membrane protein [Hymenobacter yonginensis]WBO85331.1 RagB/SusD family nutrient uptake outer membrane protein [Hymenobacter yonginensis]
MKKILYPILAALLVTTSCDILDKEPLPSITPVNFFQNADDAEAGISAAYDALQQEGNYGLDLIAMGEMPTDNASSTNGDVTDLDRFTWRPTTKQVRTIYTAAYIGINRANAVLKYVPTITMPEARRNQILGEARFLRALHYFNLVRLYGGVPLRLEPTETGDPAVLNLSRASADQIYAQIVDDLTQAAQLAPVGDATSRTRATRGSVNGLLARVQLTQRNWAAAGTAAAQVVASGFYTLEATPKGLYPANNRRESVFEVQFAGADDGGNIFPDVALPAPPATFSFPKFNIPTPELLGGGPNGADTTTYAPNNPQQRRTDLRWAYLGNVTGGRDHVSYVDGGPGTGNDDGAFVYKWPGNPNSFNSPDNTYVIRYADVLLMQAEAANEQGQTAAALPPLNQVRTRAGLAALTAASPEAASQATLRNEIDRQRRLELAFEGERWFDLLRYTRHEAAQAGVNHPKDALDAIQEKLTRRDVNYLLLPIPQQETNTNPNVTQNPGY